MLVLVLALGSGAIALQLTRNSRLGSEATEQIEQLIEDGQVGLALRHLGRYLESFPNDQEMLFLQARLQSERISGFNDVKRVAGMHQRLVTQYPDHPEIDEVIARLADLYIRLSDIYRTGYIPEQVARESRYRAAQDLAQQLIEKNEDDPTGYLLKGKALEGMITSGSQAEAEDALEAYQEVLALNEKILARDPDDSEAASNSSEAALRAARLNRDRLDKPADAEKILDRLARVRPDDPEPWLIRYIFHRETRDHRAAEAAIRKAREKAPDDPTVTLLAVDYALLVGDTAIARAEFDTIPEQYRNENPRQISLFSGLIEYYEQPKNPDPAMIAWREGLNLIRGGDEELTWWLAYVLINSNRLDEAREMVTQYRRLSGGEDNPNYQLLIALQFEKQARHGDAIRILSDLRREENTAEQIRDKALLALARCHEAIGDRAEAERYYQLASQANPRSSKPIIERARLLEGSGQSQEAIRLLASTLNSRGGDLQLLLSLMQLRLVEQANRPPSSRSWTEFDRLATMAQDANVVEIELMLADRDALDGRADLADDRLRAALERWPKSQKLWAARAELLKRLGRPDEAIALLERGLESIGDGPTIRVALARLLVDLGRGQEAQRRLIEGIEGFSPGQKAELWQAVGLLRKAQGDYDGARTAFEQWRALATLSPDPILALVDVALLANRLPEAGMHLEQLKALNGERDPNYKMARASILLRGAERARGDDKSRLLTQANSTIDEVLGDAPDLAPALLLSGRIHEALGQDDQAVDAYRKAWKRKAQEALPRLADVLVRHRRFDELEQLMTAASSGADAGASRLSAQALLAAGQVDRANRLLDSAVDDPNSPAFAYAWRSRLLSLSGRLDELENLLRREADRSEAGNPGPWIELVTIQARLGRDQATLDVTIREALRHLSVIPSALLEAQLRWAIGDAQGADEALEEGLDDDNPALIIGAASYYQKTGRPDRAEPLLERLMNVPEVSSAAALELALLLADRAAGDPETWKRALGLAADGPMDADRRIAVAVVQARAPDPAQRREAIQAFENLMADLPVMHPRAVDARNQLSWLLLELGEADRASQVAAISARQPAASAEAITWHVRTLLAAGRPAEAGAELIRLELLKPGDTKVADLRAEQLLRTESDSPNVLLQQARDRIDSPGGNLFARSAVMQLLTIDSPEASRAAEQLARTLAERSPKHRWVTGLVLATQGNSDEALNEASSALGTVDLTDETDRLGLTEAVMGAIRSSSAEDRTALVGLAQPIIDAMLKRRDGDPDLLIASAVLSHQIGDFENEARLYRQVLQRRPGDPLAHYNLALVLSEGLGQPEEALRLIDRLASRVGSVAPVLGARGVILTRLGRFDEAIEDLEQAIEIEPSADRHYFLARAYHKAGQDDRFRAEIDQARQAGLTPELVDRWQHDEMRELLSL